jgi:degradative hydroxymethylglutaryl-CoA reductase
MVDPMTCKNKSFEGFYKKTVAQRHDIFRKNFQDTSIEILKSGGLTTEYANLMVENCIGKISLPLGLGLHFVINGNRFSIPMAIEEPSVIAAASGGAKFIAENGGGFLAFSSKPTMIGQIQLVDLDVTAGQYIIEHNRNEIIRRCNMFCQNMLKRGGGVYDFRCKKLEIPEEYRQPGQKFTSMLIFEFMVNVCDSMGANLVNTIAEGVSPYLQALTGGRVALRILTNLCSERRTISFFKIPINKMTYKQYSGREISQRVIEAYLFAKLDPYRAATHNKGIFLIRLKFSRDNEWN